MWRGGACGTTTTREKRMRPRQSSSSISNPIARIASHRLHPSVSFMSTTTTTSPPVAPHRVRDDDAKTQRNARATARRLDLRPNRRPTHARVDAPPRAPRPTAPPRRVDRPDRPRRVVCVVHRLERTSRARARAFMHAFIHPVWMGIIHQSRVLPRTRESRPRASTHRRTVSNHTRARLASSTTSSTTTPSSSVVPSVDQCRRSVVANA